MPKQQRQLAFVAPQLLTLSLLVCCSSCPQVSVGKPAAQSSKYGNDENDSGAGLAVDGLTAKPSKCASTDFTTSRVGPYW